MICSFVSEGLASGLERKGSREIRRAIIQSLSPFNPWCNQDRFDAVEVAQPYLSLLGVSDAADLLTVDAERLLAVHSLMIRRWPPTRLSHGARSAPSTWVRSRPAIRRLLADVPYPRKDFELLIGFAKNGWQFFRGHSDTASHGTREQVFAVLQQVFGDETEALYEAYRRIHLDHHAPGHTRGDMMSFVVFKFPSLLITDDSAHQGVPTHGYQFSCDLPGFGGHLRAVHTGNTPLVFRDIDERRLEKWPSYDGTDREELRRLAATVETLYGSVIRAGDPGPTWPECGEGDSTVLWFGRIIEARTGLSGAEMEALRSCGLENLAGLERRLVHNLRAACPVHAPAQRMVRTPNLSPS